ncbi:7843_t:CDS:10 [Ambispora leptoticha]|uniref:DIS3-like exonuclease 2 n=1 Tax=Ambispora leptoticha TaxID=144679 RepID=A0A9N8VCK6_9GLOM|nr:7843_t:CDS:10 [Ambispora leptoticha]
MSDETNQLSEHAFSVTTSGTSSSLVNDSISVTAVTVSKLNNETSSQEDSSDKQGRKKQNKQNSKGLQKSDSKDAKTNKPVAISEDNNSNDTNDDKKKKEKRPSKNRTFSSESSDQIRFKETEVLDLTDPKGQHQRRKSTANAAEVSNKNKSNNNGNTDKSAAVHRRGKSVANVGELQNSSSRGAVKSRGSKDDSENKSEALESLQQIIASLKNLPAPPKPQKPDKKEGEESPADAVSKHKRNESNVSNNNAAKRSSAAAAKHKKGASVSFSFPLTTSVTTSLKSIHDSEDGKPIMDIENALQDTISSLRRMSLDKGKAQQQKDNDVKKKDEDDDKKNSNNRKSLEEIMSSDKQKEPESPRSPFEFKKPLEDQSQNAAKKTHRRHQSLGHTLSAAASSNATLKVPPPIHHRRHSVALNGSMDVLKELEKNQGRPTSQDVKGHRRSNSRNFDSNWRANASPVTVINNPQFQPFSMTKFGASLPQYLKNGELVSGVLRINKRNRSDAYVTTESLDADIYICGSKDRNRALEGDVVAVELLDPEKKVDKKKDDVEVEGQGLLLFEDDDIVTDDQRPKYCGHVVAVMERMPGQLFSGTLALLRPSSTATKEREAAEKARREAEDRAAGIEPRYEEAKQDKRDDRNDRPKIVWFKPTDKRVPLIAIPTEQAPVDFVEKHQAYAQQLFVACIKRWPITSLHPFGTLVTQIGEIGGIDVETEALLRDNNVSSDDFNENVTKCLPSMPWNIPDREFESRLDLRSNRIFTIDPLDTNDIDDAVSCTRLPDGKYEIGVHIADVSFFVKPNTALDRDARKRATSVYLVQKSVPMLPPLLSEQLCSLNPGVDRLAFSVIWKMNPDGKVLETYYGRTIIRPCTKLSYDHAQEVIEGKPLNPNVKIYNDFPAKEIEADIKALARRLRENRFRRGALFLNSTKLGFELDENNEPIECHVIEKKDANLLIEEFMLLANMSVAQKISSAFPEQALLRRHAAPIERRLNDFVEHASRLGCEIDSSSAGALQRSFDTIEDGTYFCTGTLDIAKYHHYALNTPLYTHFTSPIRRYADVLVHRMLESALNGEKRFYLDKDTVQKTANHCNVKKDASKNAQEQGSHLFLCVLLNKLTVQTGPVIREAVVVGVKDHAFDVFVRVFGIEKRVHLDQLPLEKFEFDMVSNELTLVWKAGDEHRLFDASSDIGEDEDDEIPTLDVNDGLTSVTDAPNNNNNNATSSIYSVSSHISTPPVENYTTENPMSNQISQQPKFSIPFVKTSELPHISLITDPSIPNSQIIRELGRLQVVVTADCKKSPPVIKVLAVNPYAALDKTG